MKLVAILACFSFVISIGCNMSEPESNESPTNGSAERRTPESATGISQHALSRFPSASKTQILYNASQERVDDYGDYDEECDEDAAGYGEIYPQEGDGFEYLNTVPQPEWIDTYDPMDGLYKPFVKYLTQIGYPQITEFGDQNYETDHRRWMAGAEDTASVMIRGVHGGVPVDRTIMVSANDENMYTAEFIRHLQSTFLKKFPLWRIWVSVTDITRESEGLMIYPSVVRVREDCCPPDDLDKSLQGWREHVAIMYGPERRQFREVKRRLKEKTAELRQSEQPFVFVAGFDHWSGNFDKHSVWLLQKESNYFLRLTKPAGCGAGSSYHVRPDGTIDFTENRWDSNNFELYEYTFPPTGPYSIIMSGYKRKPSEKVEFEPDGREWTFDIDPDDIITDASLKATTQEDSGPSAASADASE